jgi:CubicO group peptidase (beta-lactamase class C family)
MRYFCLITLNLLLFTSIMAQQPGKIMDADLKENNAKTDVFLKKMYANKFLNGTLLIAEKGKTVYHNSFGLANPETGEKLSPNASFRLASVSKQFIGMGIMILQEKGKLDYDDNIKKYLPELLYEDITVRNLLNHTGGLPDYMSLFENNWDTEKPQEERKTAFNADMVAMFAKKMPEIDFKPGDKYDYSNTGFVLLGEIIERASGQPIRDFLQESIFDKAGMTNSQAFSTTDKFSVNNRVYGFSYSADGQSFKENDWTFLNGMIGDGGIYASAPDMLKWSNALTENKLVKRSTLEEAYKPVTLNDGTVSNYGFGWGLNISEEDGHLEGVQHTGGWVGFRTVIVRSFDTERTFILLTSNSSRQFGDLMRGVATIWKGGEAVVPNQSVTVKIAELLAKNVSEEELFEQFENLQRNEADRYDFEERNINDFGYSYLGEGELDKAIMIFKLNVKNFPESANAFDSLGEAYLAQAKLNYQKAYQMNPANEGAKNILEKMGVNTEGLVKTIVIEDDLLTSYIGKYQLSPDFVFTVRKDGKQLFVQATGQPEFEVFPLSENKFYLKAVDAQISFTEDAKSLILHQGGKKQEATRMKN